MASVLEALFKFLRILRVARDHLQLERFPGRGASLLSLLVREFNALWRFCLGKPGASLSLKPAERPFPGTKTRPSSVSGSSAVVKEYVIAASTIPTSASHLTLNEYVPPEAVAIVIPPPTPANLSVNASYTPVLFEGKNLAHRSSGNLSIQSRASDRLSIITTSRDSIRAPLGQPSRAPRAAHLQFGRGPGPSRSREVSRSPSPIAYAASPQPRVEIDTTNVPSSVNNDGTDSPVAQPSSSYQHEPLSPLPVHGHRSRQSLTSVVVAIQNPSTESVPVYQHDERSLLSRISTEYFLPEGRFIQLIHSDQVPRYTKDIKISREETHYDVKPLTTTFPYYAEPTSPEEGSLKLDCSPWIPATHPDGALYFYDPERIVY
ncbi:hypothetical protein BC827DRAFT_182701 [Russula dissimulans]|nr:hypothetical protein BC827DRAFT_182701 [Russula dissimulans]